MDDCDLCAQEAARGCSYCTKCGKPLTAAGPAQSDRCDRCAQDAGAGFSYCTKCGRPLAAARPAYAVPETKKDDTLRKIVLFVGIIILIGCTAMIFFEMFALFWTFGGIWNGMEGYGLGIIMVVPVPVVLFYVYGIFAKFYFLFLVFAVVVSFILLMYNSREGLGELFKGRAEKLESAPLYSVVTLFAMYISINLMLVILVTSFGYEPTVPEDPEEDWMLWYSLLNASVWEEVACRVVFIGIPLMIAGLAAGAKDSWKRLAGGGEMNKLAVFLIIVSAAIFAFAHAPGWDLFKVIPTFVCGLALGYLFVRYGLYASIMLHFLIDYSSSVTWIFGSSLAGEMPTGAELMLTLFLFSMLFLGIPFIIRYAKRGFAYLKNLS